MVAGLGIRSESGDGNDVLEVYEKVSRALSEIRAGSGPRFLEFSTYRWLEHCGPNYDNHIGYRTQAEYEHWRALEPIARFQAVLLSEEIISDVQVEEMDAAVALEVVDAFAFAEAAAPPAAECAYTDLYWSEQSSTGFSFQVAGA